MANLEEDNIRRQYSSKILSLKLVPLTKDVSAPSEFLLSNNLNDKIDTIEKSEKKLQTYSNSRYYKKFKKLAKVSKKSLEIKTRGTTVEAKPEVTTTTKNNDRGINDHNTTKN